MKAFLIYPHQLYDPKILLKKLNEYVSFHEIKYIFLVEEYLYFKYFNFHKLKIKFHIESMQAYYRELKNYFVDFNIKIIYLKSHELLSTEIVELIF